MLIWKYILDPDPNRGVLPVQPLLLGTALKRSGLNKSLHNICLKKLASIRDAASLCEDEFVTFKQNVAQILPDFLKNDRYFGSTTCRYFFYLQSVLVWFLGGQGWGGDSDWSQDPETGQNSRLPRKNRTWNEQAFAHCASPFSDVRIFQRQWLNLIAIMILL